jgi:TonB family protein
LPDTGEHISIEVDSIGGFYQSWMSGRVRKEWISNIDSVNHLLYKALDIARSDSFLFDHKNKVYLRIYAGHTDQDDPIPSLADVDSIPEFPGGHDSLLAFMKKVLAYPDSEWNASIQGKQFVMFVIETDGSITNLAIHRSITPAMDSASIRAVRSMPRWKPAQIQGKPVPCRMVLPIEWKLIEKGRS